MHTHCRNPSARLLTLCGLSVAGLLLREDLAGVTCAHCLRLSAASPASRALEVRRVQLDWIDERRKGAGS
jgi:hypothetical protein